MAGRVRLPTLAIAIALLGLIAVLATFQYKWLGRISDAERDRMRASLNTRATAYAQDFDAELTRAFLLFEVDAQGADTVAARLAARYERWQATARYPGIIKDVYVAGADSLLHRYNPATRSLDPVVWPAVLEPIRARLTSRPDAAASGGAFFVRALPPIVWESVPALLIPTPIILFNQRAPDPRPHLTSGFSFTVLLLDRDYITTDMLPELARQHFRQTGDGFDYQLAIVSTGDRH
jgi:hypothetical protein